MIKKVTNVGLIEVIQLPETSDPLTSKLHVENVISNSIDES